MRRAVRRSPAILAALALLAGGCATAPSDPHAPLVHDGIEIAPYGIHETCFRLAAGDRVDWRFESRAPVDFNLHYHEGASVVMPITKLASYGDSGIFPVRVPHDYCAMWEAGPAGAIVSYWLKPSRAAP